ncbi:hypothetical protein BDY24DRAFT_416779 [Mrakia frigida]|uniref:uncharacterized protein n=1 Tax=Mrakia frigida TaxID=29902 RepID=UPI003FCC0241
MDFSTMVTSVLGPFLPAPILNFARSHLDSFATQADSTLSGYAPRFLLDQMPLLMSLVALYFGFLSVMRAARVAWRSFIFAAKYGGLALFGTLLYSLYQGDTTALRSTFSTASSLVSSAASLGGLSSLGTLAAWYLGSDNTEAVKNVGAWAYKYFSPDSDSATSSSTKRSSNNKKKKKANSNSNVWDSFLPKSEGKSGSPSANTRSKKGGKVDSKGLFEDVFGETPKRAGGGGGEGGVEEVVKGFMDKVVGTVGEETVAGLKKMAWDAFNGEEKKKDGQGRTRGR